MENNVEISIGLPIGLILNNRYRIDAILAMGGFGITYRAWDCTLEKKVAIKEFYPNGLVTRTEEKLVSVYVTENEDQFEHGKTRFLREARDVSRFSNNPNIVTVFDFFEANGTAYIVMEFLEGMTLKQYIDRSGGRIDESMAINVIFALMTTLETVHNEGVVHRDIAPDNIFVCNDKRIKLIDFGAARETTDMSQNSSSVILKHGYAPVEQYSRHGNIGPWTDVYAFGALIYYMMTGVRPLDSVDRMIDDSLEPPSHLNPSIPYAMDVVTMKALKVNAKDRYQNMGEMRADYLRLSQGQNTQTAPGDQQQIRTEASDKKTAVDRTKTPGNGGKGEKKQAAPSKSRKWIPIAGIAGVLVAAGILCLVFLGKKDGSTDPGSSESSTMVGTENPSEGTADTNTGELTEQPTDKATEAPVGQSYAEQHGVKAPDPSSWTDEDSICIYCWDDSLESEIKEFKERFPQYRDYIEYVKLGISSTQMSSSISDVLKNQENGKYPSVFCLGAGGDALGWIHSDPAELYNLYDLGFTDDTLSNCYSADVDYGRSGDQLYALPVYSSIGTVVYNRRIAQEVFGTDDPDQVQELVKDWDSYLNTAARLKEKGYMINSSLEEINYPILHSRTAAWVTEDAEGHPVFQADDSIRTYLSITKTLYDSGYTHDTKFRSTEWTADTKPGANVFMYFIHPSNLKNMRKNGMGKGEWGVIRGPEDFFWGEKFLVIGKDTPNPELAAFLVCELVCDPELALALVNTNNKPVNNREAMDQLANDYLGSKNDLVLFLNNQNPYPVWKQSEENLKLYPTSLYDSDIWALLRQYGRSYYEGDLKNASLDEVVAAMEQEVNQIIQEP